MSRRLGLVVIVVAVAAIGSYALARPGAGTNKAPSRDRPEAATTAAATATAVTVSVANLRQGLVAHLSHRLLRPGEACPVTRPNPRSYTAPAALRSVLNGDLQGVYGRGAMAVILPAGRINVSRDPHHGWYREKVAWWVDVPGALHIAARRIDRYSATLGRGDIAPPIPTGAHRIEPTNILLPTPGCWQVAGGVGRQALTWIFHARA